MEIALIKARTTALEINAKTFDGMPVMVALLVDRVRLLLWLVMTIAGAMILTLVVWLFKTLAASGVVP